MDEKDWEKYWKIKLTDLNKALENNNFTNLDEYSWPMIPYVGPDYAKANKKILFVGKEPNGWGENPCSLGKILKEPNGIERIISEPREFILNRVVPYYGGERGNNPYKTNLLLRLYYFVGKILCDDRIEPNTRNMNISRKCFRSIAWTNIFKICTQEENSNVCPPPDSKMKNFLLTDFCTLEYEIEQLRPDLIVFSTGPRYDNYLEKIFTPKINIISTIHRGISEVKGLTITAFRTYHFGHRKPRPYELLDKLIELSFPSKTL